MHTERSQLLFCVALVALGANCGGGGGPKYATLWIENSATYADGRTIGDIHAAPEPCAGTVPNPLTLLSVSVWRGYLAIPEPGTGHILDIPPLAPGESVVAEVLLVNDPGDDRPFLFTCVWSDGTTSAFKCLNWEPILLGVDMTQQGDFVLKFLPPLP